MPLLPTINVSQAHFDRLVAAFPGATLEEKSTAYKAWLINGLIDEVLKVEGAKYASEVQAENNRRRNELIASLPARA